MNNAGLFKQYGCRDVDGKRVGAGCGRLGERGHGRWYFRCSVRDLYGRSVQVRRGGFPSQAAARAARDQTLTESREQLADRTWTVARWLRYWLTTRMSIRPTTLRVYTQHVEAYLIPAIGQIRLAEVTTRHLTAMFGLRRGEAAGVRWQDVDLDRRQLSIVSQRTTIGYQVIEGPPKSAASRRTIASDRRTAAVLRSHQRAQRQACPTEAGRGGTTTTSSPAPTAQHGTRTASPNASSI